MSFINIQSLNDKQIVDGFNGKFLHTSNITIGYVTAVAGSVLPEHSHVHEQITHVLEGKLQMTIADETSLVEAGRVAVIPSNTKHSAIALTNCKLLDVFNPVREEYK